MAAVEQVRLCQIEQSDGSTGGRSDRRVYSEDWQWQCRSVMLMVSKLYDVETCDACPRVACFNIQWREVDSKWCTHESLKSAGRGVDWSFFMESY